MLYQEINSGHELRLLFRDYGREEHFTPDGYDALFDFLDSTGEDYKVDVIGLCCEFYECDAEELVRDYAEDYWDEDELEEWAERDDIDEQAHELSEMCDAVWVEFSGPLGYHYLLGQY